MDWYRVTKTIRGRKYLYDQQTYRVGRSVKTRNHYIGPAGNAPGPSSSSTSAANRQSPITVDAEPALIAALFDPSRATRWSVPWSHPYKSTTLSWTPDARVLDLPYHMHIPVVSLPYLRHNGRKYGPDGAAFSPDKNRIIIPDPSKFRGIDDDTTAEQQFHAALLHECAHATALTPELRRRRYLCPTFGAADYAQEEVVAELTAQLVMHRLGLAGTVSRTAAHYIQHWLALTGNYLDARTFAEEEAVKAADYLCALIALHTENRAHDTSMIK